MRVDELSDAISRVLRHVEAAWGPEIELGADHYWVVAAGEAFDLHQKPEVTVGQLSDDTASIREQLEAADEPVVWHDLAHIVGVLARLAALDSPESAPAA